MCSASVDDMRAAARELASVVGGDSRDRAMAQAARLTGMSFRRFYSFFYGQARRVDAHEWLAAQQALEAARAARIAKLEHELAMLRASRREAP